MPTTEIQEIIRKCLSSWSNLDLQYSSEYDKVEKEMTEALNEAYTLGHRAAIEEVLQKVVGMYKQYRPTTEEWYVNYDKIIALLKESDNGSAQEK